jgi:predicted ATP-binding protein involved in virulence
MDSSLRLKTLRVTGLQDSFNYKIQFPGDGDVVILIAPNGYGKTALLALINACLQLRTAEASRHQFETLEVVFADNSRWCFKKTQDPERLPSGTSQRGPRLRVRSRRRREAWVEVRFYDRRGREQKAVSTETFSEIPHEILARALDRFLPVDRVGFDSFMDFRKGDDDTVSMSDLVERYHSVLVGSDEFKRMLGDYERYIYPAPSNRPNCVFIETQRLLFTARPREGESGQPETTEEILRQARHLANLLQTTYSNYASTSQALDRTFPNRLIARAAKPGPRDASGLRTELDAIESRRRALTEAGILVETAEPLIPPRDELLPNVTDALEIYVEDSRKKLSTFDEIYPKVSIFRDLLSKKLHPKELTINRDSGAQIRLGSKTLSLDGLSSGEKHEFIMLFKLIFETAANALVLIDEPEISLHVLWQLEFIADLQSIQRVNRFQSIIATHSPQIFQGMEDRVVDLAEQVQ